MRFSLRSSIVALAFSAILAIPASAAQLGISGNAEVGSDFISFGLGTAPNGGPYNMPPGTGNFLVNQVDPGVFQTLGITANQTGAIRSFSTTSPSTVPPFMSFTGSNVTLTGTVPRGTFGPFFLQDTNFGAVAAFNVSGSVLQGGTTVADYSGTLAATFTGMSSGALLGTIARGGVVNTPYSGTFTATLTPAVPEPGTLLLMGAGLLGAGLIARKRKVRN